MREFDDLASSYEELLRDPLRDQFASGSDFFIQQKCRVVTRRLARLGRGKPLRVLDAGCGQGSAFRFFDNSTKVFGCDVSQGMLRSAVARRPVAVQEPLALPFPDAAFDAAYAFCVYHHIPTSDHLRHLSELRRVVSFGGEVMVFEHNPYNPVTSRIFKRAPIDRGCEMIAPPTLRELFREAGFRDVTVGYLLFVPESLHRIFGVAERALSWLPLGGQYYVAGRK
jgi:SAM-dependent methyltransferase